MDTDRIDEYTKDGMICGGGGRWPSGLERWTGDRVVLGSNPGCCGNLASPSEFCNNESRTVTEQ